MYNIFDDPVFNPSVNSAYELFKDTRFKYEGDVPGLVTLLVSDKLKGTRFMAEVAEVKQADPQSFCLEIKYPELLENFNDLFKHNKFTISRYTEIIKVKENQ